MGSQNVDLVSLVVQISLQPFFSDFNGICWIFKIGNSDRRISLCSWCASSWCFSHVHFFSSHVRLCDFPYSFRQASSLNLLLIIPIWILNLQHFMNSFPLVCSFAVGHHIYIIFIFMNIIRTRNYTSIPKGWVISCNFACFSRIFGFDYSSLDHHFWIRNLILLFMWRCWPAISSFCWFPRVIRCFSLVPHQMKRYWTFLLHVLFATALFL